MALKDWKKLRTTGEIPAWHNNQTNEDIWIVKSISDSKGRKFDYEFRSDISSPRTIKSFKTQSQAISFARNYMRKN